MIMNYFDAYESLGDSDRILKKPMPRLWKSRIFTQPHIETIIDIYGNYNYMLLRRWISKIYKQL